MMKLVLKISEDDDALKEGGPLARRIWPVGHIHVSVQSGYGDDTSAASAGKPKLYVHAADNFWHGPDYSRAFDLPAFEQALSEAKAEVVRMEKFLADVMARLITEANTEEVPAVDIRG